MSLPAPYDRPASSADGNLKPSPMAPVPTRFLVDPKSLLALEIGDEDSLKQCHFAPFRANLVVRAAGACANPVFYLILNRFWH
jgi:hypothetical protein